MAQHGEAVELLDEVTRLLDQFEETGDRGVASSATGNLKKVSAIMKGLAGNPQDPQSQQQLVALSTRMKAALTRMKELNSKKLDSASSEPPTSPSAGGLAEPVPSTTPPQRTIFPSTHPLCGHLMKQGDKGMIKAWKKRWFQQKLSRLYYYKSESDNTPINFIDLKLACPIEPAVGTRFQIALRADAGGRVYHLRAATDGEVEYWIEGLSKTVERYSQMARDRTGTEAASVAAAAANQLARRPVKVVESGIVDVEQAERDRQALARRSVLQVADAPPLSTATATQVAPARNPFAGSESPPVVKQATSDEKQYQQVDTKESTPPAGESVEPGAVASSSPTPGPSPTPSPPTSSWNPFGAKSPKQPSEPVAALSSDGGDASPRPASSPSSSLLSSSLSAASNLTSTIVGGALSALKLKSTTSHHSSDAQPADDGVNGAMTSTAAMDSVARDAPPSAATPTPNTAPTLSLAAELDKERGERLRLQRAVLDWQQRERSRADELLECQRQLRLANERSIAASKQADSVADRANPTREVQHMRDTFDRVQQDALNAEREADALRSRIIELHQNSKQQAAHIQILSSNLTESRRVANESSQLVARLSSVLHDAGISFNEALESNTGPRNSGPATASRPRKKKSSKQQAKESALTAEKLQSSNLALMAHSQFLASEIDSCRQELDSMLAVKDDLIRQLQAQLASVKRRYQQVRGANVALGKDDYTDQLESELLMLKKELFFALGAGAKLQLVLSGDSSNLNLAELYDSVRIANIPVSEWPTWIAKQLDADGGDGDDQILSPM